MAEPTVTQMLTAFSRGDAEAGEALLPEVYDALRAIAHNHLRHEQALPTLNTTALVHEAYLKLVDIDRVDWKSRAHFFALASRVMRRVLIDYARRKRRHKRGGGAAHVPLDEGLHLCVTAPGRLLALDEALDRLATFDARQAQIVEYRFFGGLTIQETADLMGLSPATIKREWTVAKAWLHGQVQPG